MTPPILLKKAAIILAFLVHKFSQDDLLKEAVKVNAEFQDLNRAKGWAARSCPTEAFVDMSKEQFPDAWQNKVLGHSNSSSTLRKEQQGVWGKTLNAQVSHSSPFLHISSSVQIDTLHP